MVTHTAALEGKLRAGRGQGGGQPAAGPVGGDVVGRLVGVGAVQAVAGDDGVHQAGVAGPQRRLAEADPLQGGDADVGEENVGAVDQGQSHLPSLLGGEVDGDAPLRAVVQLEHRIGRELASQHATEGASGIAPRRLDLDHVGAPVGEDPAGRGSGHPHAQLHDLHA